MNHAIPLVMIHGLMGSLNVPWRPSTESCRDGTILLFDDRE